MRLVTAARFIELRRNGYFRRHGAKEAEVPVAAVGKKPVRAKTSTEKALQQEVLSILDCEFKKARHTGTFTVRNDTASSLTIYAEINGKSCFIQMQDCTYQPKPSSPDCCRARPSFEMVSTHDVFINIKDRAIDIYIIPTAEAKNLIFPNAVERSERRKGKITPFPYPASENSKFEPFRFRWDPLI